MASKVKGNGKAKPRPGIQVVLRVSHEIRKALEAAAKAGYVSMNRAAESRLATGRWPRPIKEAK